jgi:hypothetical protein
MSHMSIHEGIARHFIPKAPKPTNTTSWWLRNDGESPAEHEARFYREVAARNPELQTYGFGKTLGSLSHGPNQGLIREPGAGKSRHEEL